MRRLSLMMRVTCRALIYRIETRHFLETQGRPVQCPERAPDYEGGEQPRKFVVIGHETRASWCRRRHVICIHLNYPAGSRATIWLILG